MMNLSSKVVPDADRKRLKGWWLGTAVGSQEMKKTVSLLLANTTLWQPTLE